MAAIRMSNRLKSEILKNVDQLFESRKKNLNNEIIGYVSQQAVLNTLYERQHLSTENKKHLDKFSTDHPTLRTFLSKPEKVSFQVRMSVDKEPILIHTTTNPSWAAQKFYCEVGWIDRYSSNSATVPIKILLESKARDTLKGLNTNLDKAIDLLFQLNDLAGEMKLLKDKATLIVSNSNSLKQFLEAWPQGQLLVPDEDMEKMHAKKSTKSQVLEKAGLNDEEVVQMNAALLKAKMTKTD